MSYILFFWKEQPGADIAPEKLIAEMDDGMTHRGIDYLSFDEVRAAFHREFPEICDMGLSLSWEYFDSRFEAVPIFKSSGLVSLVQVYCTKCGITVERVRAVASSLATRIYDPQWAESARQLGIESPWSRH